MSSSLSNLRVEAANWNTCTAVLHSSKQNYFLQAYKNCKPAHYCKFSNSLKSFLHLNTKSPHQNLINMKNFACLLFVAAIIYSCNTASTMGGADASANKARVQSFYDQVINAHSTAAIDSFCSADFVDHNPDPGRSGKGSDDLKASFKDFFTGYPDIHVKTNFMIAEGDTVMAHVTLTGTNSGALGNMPATNKQISVDGIDVIVLKDGKANERWGFFDTQKMMQDLGMMPQPGQHDTATKKK